MVDNVRESGQILIRTTDLGRSSMEYLKKEIAHNKMVYCRIESLGRDAGDEGWMLRNVHLK